VKIVDLFVISLCFVWFMRKSSMFLNLDIKSAPHHLNSLFFVRFAGVILGTRRGAKLGQKG